MSHRSHQKYVSEERMAIHEQMLMLKDRLGNLKALFESEDGDDSESSPLFKENCLMSHAT